MHSERRENILGNLNCGTGVERAVVWEKGNLRRTTNPLTLFSR